ncbi:MAG: helix-turn-helix domain-containing protein, partial [Gammaproteobacteria bacterium]|nr:helix-turn-helix domain-containing protein [Gammaproteobacteria bacterium]
LRALWHRLRKSGYKWIERYEREGPAGLAERSRRPQMCPTQTPEGVVQALIGARERHPSWGAKKLLALLSRRHPDGVDHLRRPRSARLGPQGPDAPSRGAPRQA